jgi:hypothetical protein
MSLALAESPSAAISFEHIYLADLYLSQDLDDNGEERVFPSMSHKTHHLAGDSDDGKSAEDNQEGSHVRWDTKK